MNEEMEKKFEIADPDLRRGIKDFESKVKNLKGILDKLTEIMDVSSYQEELDSIFQKAYSDFSLQSKMPYEAMQMDYESNIFSPYIKEIVSLTKRVEKESLPIYEIHLLIKKINEGLSNLEEDSIGDTIILSKQLLDAINKLDTHNHPEKNSFVQKAYETIYEVLLVEEIFDRSEVLDYLKELNIPNNRENIGRLISKDIKNVSSSDVIDEELKNIETEGLGYDFLSREFIQKVTGAVIGEKSEEYQIRKKKAYDLIKSEAVSLSVQRNTLQNELDNEKKNLHGLQLNKSALRVKFLSLFLIPAVMITSGYFIGKNASNKVIEYKTITRTIDMNTGEIVGDEEIIYDEHPTTYVATVVECSPWRRNPTGVGYIRNAVAYNYSSPESSDEDFHATLEDLEGNLIEKYRYVETKDQLDPGENLNDKVIYITETYQDKTVTKNSTKYIIPFTLGGGVLGAIISIILYFTGIVDPEEIQNMIYRLNKDIQKKRMSQDEINKKILSLRNNAISLRSDYQKTVKKYGKVDEKMFTEDEDAAWVIKEKEKELQLTK